MENSTITAFRENDIFYWRYKPELAKTLFEPYWAKSRIAIVKGDYLYDTFWLHDLNGPPYGATDSTQWRLDDAASNMELEFVANLEDLVKFNEWEAVYIDGRDIVNLNHSNHPKGNFYVRKGAQRSRRKMLEQAALELETQEHNRDSAIRNIEQIRETIKKIEDGHDLYSIYIWRSR